MSKAPLTPGQGLDLDNPNQTAVNDGPIECLAQSFENDTARREYYLGLLAEKLKDPEFRNTEGFPIGEDEDILNLSDPPYYTACPNPFIQEFIDCHGKPYDANDKYKCEPYAVDVSEGKNNPIYRAHSYHTKVPHLAIVPSILHYTEPGDIVLDGFCGSGMTGVAGQWCSNAPEEYRKNLESEWQNAGAQPPAWGGRHMLISDLSPAATFIAANYNLPFDVVKYKLEATRIIDELENEFGWMYKTKHDDGISSGNVVYTVWSEVFSCPECVGEIVFYDVALDPASKRIKDKFECPSCKSVLTKKKLDKRYISKYDRAIKETIETPKRVPVLINYKYGKKRYEKSPDQDDIDNLKSIDEIDVSNVVPTNIIPKMHMTHERARMDRVGVTHVHHFFTNRSLQIISAYLDKARTIENKSISNALVIVAQHQFVNATLMNRYRPASSFGNAPMGGVYYISSMIAEANVISLITGSIKRVDRMAKAGWEDIGGGERKVMVSTQSAANLSQIKSSSVDYIFTDPPFGENIYYADLNFLVESWHRVLTDAGPEAIVDKFKNKKLLDYQVLMQSCFNEYFRVIKPGRWMTVVFHNSKNAVWNAIQEGLQAVGFVVADVRTLDKKQGSYRQVTSSAVKQDLVISVYKPEKAIEDKFDLVAGTANGVWDFVDMHLRQVVTFDSTSDVAITIAERLPHRLFDRMVAYHVQKGIAVPMSFGDFYQGLDRYARRDEMYFLPEQVAEYDKNRMTVKEVMQLEIAVSDEESAIQWVKQQLEKKPYTFSELQPLFMRERQSGWNKYEQDMELETLLQDNYLDASGESPIPPQVLQWMKMSEPTRKKIEAVHKDGTYEDNQGLHTKNVDLLAIAKGRWFIPSPENAAQLIEKRTRALLREFDGYTKFTGKQLKEFRLEVVRAGFFKAYQDKNYKMIVSFASKLPEAAVQNDEKLLQWVDVSQTRLSDESLF